MSAALYSWGRYPTHAQTAHACHWRADVAAQLAGLAVRHGTSLPFGNGRSYGDSCLAASDHVLQLRPLNRLIEADWHTGRITAEAGLTLDALLALAIPRGWFLPVTPGTRFVTLGGALANYVHGKNHHVRGTYGCHVQRFGLVRSDRPAMVCSPQENAEFFAATIGGLGLTGVVEWLALQLVPIRSSQIEVRQIRFGGLDAFFALSDELDHQHEYALAWIDCLATGKARGRGIYSVGDHANNGPLEVAQPSRVRVLLTPPLSVMNRVSLRLFNSAYFHGHRTGRQRSQVRYDAFFYPLDRVLHWNRLYGPRGFQQYQCVLPTGNAAAAIHDLLAAVSNAHTGSFLAVLKRFGNQRSPGLLSFSMAGTTLALDLPQQGDSTRQLMERLDSILRAAAGRLYPAKDAHMSALDFQTCYPQWQQCEALRDPAINSRFWQRSTAV
jgi:FAD/FMN-containing dehydrogenase